MANLEGSQEKAVQGEMRGKGNPGPLMVDVFVILILCRKMMDLSLSLYQEACYDRRNSKVLPQLHLLRCVLNHIVLHLSVVAPMNSMEHHSYDNVYVPEGNLQM